MALIRLALRVAIVGALASAVPMAGLGAAMAASNAAATVQAEQIPLTGDAVAGFVKSYPDLKVHLTALGKKYNIKSKAKDLATGLSAWVTASEAYGELNAAVAPYGFSDFQTWLKTAISVATAYVFAKNGGEIDSKMAAAVAEIKNNPSIPDAQKKMLLQQMQASSAAIGGMRPSQQNIDAVTPYLSQIAAIIH